MSFETNDTSADYAATIARVLTLCQPERFTLVLCEDADSLAGQIRRCVPRHQCLVAHSTWARHFLAPGSFFFLNDSQPAEYLPHHNPSLPQSSSKGQPTADSGYKGYTTSNKSLNEFEPGYTMTCVQVSTTFGSAWRNLLPLARPFRGPVPCLWNAARSI